MNRFLLSITIFILLGLPGLVSAASIKNDDSEVHQVKGRASSKGWVYVEVNPNGTKYFNCRYGCELIIEKTGSKVQLETDADVVIKNGVLEVK